MTWPRVGIFAAFALALTASRASALVIALDPQELAPKTSEASGSLASARPPSAPSAAPAVPSGPGGVSAEATASKAEVTLGERFVVEVKVTAPPGTSFTFPAEVLTDGVELRSTPDGGGAGASPTPAPPGVHRYEAALFELTDAKVPSVVVKYQKPDGGEGEATTEPIAMRIASRLPKDADPQKIADIRGPVSLAVGPAFWIALGLLIAGLLALVVWLVRRHRSAAAPSAIVRPPADPAAEAREALAALEASGLLGRGDHRGFYIALTTIAKRYLERRLGAPVLEMTTSEMVAFLRDSAKARGLVTPMRDLANAADQIKFARGAGLHAEAERHSDAVREVIRTIEDAFTPTPAEQEKVA
jgi:hypothetical protein